MLSTVVRLFPRRRLLSSIPDNKYRLQFATSYSNIRSLSTMPESDIIIGTHSGCFHCDEALACYMLKLLPRYKNASIIRTRDPKILETCDIVVDVGGVYDPSKHRYDHHQREFKESISTVLNKPELDCDIKLSSAGLIYCHFGEEVIKELIPGVTDECDRRNIFKRVYDTLIKEVDAVDNGVPMFAGEPVYRINTGLSSRVARLNPEWNGPDMDPDKQFHKAMALVGEEFLHFIQFAAKIWWPARSIVRDAILKRFEVHSSGEIIELARSLPWKEHLFELEEELGIKDVIKYVIFKDNNYRIQGVPLTSGSFVCRMFLPEKWAGLRDEELSRVSGIDDCIFVHSARFIGGNLTRDGALAMAKSALEIGKSLDNSDLKNVANA
ncbi:MYG1 protein C27H6.8 [Athalia rosae]|uniref:MYG1 protein C27H6.8 n=1 Tax=Athalia rosae TaxID=37344 RepID=UPI0020334BAA|nr:MYG1 protein C27H6.8 [Athalia rosae]